MSRIEVVALDLAVIIVLVIAICLLLGWLASVAALLWMAMLRPRLVTLVAVGIGLLAVAIVVAIGGTFSQVLLAGVLLVPLVGRPVSNRLAVRISRRIGVLGASDVRSVFDVKRAEQRRAYQAPTISPRV